MNIYQKLGIVAALKKELKAIEDDLKAEASDLLPEDGGSAAIRFDGEKVGTVVKTAPSWTECSTRDEVKLTDMAALDTWVDTCDPLVLKTYALTHADDFAEHVLNATGELPDGCSITHVAYPSTCRPSVVKVTGVTFRKVNEAMHGLTQSTINLLLEETSD